MHALNHDAFRRARELIRDKCGEIGDLPEEVRNTLANVFYRFCVLQSECGRPGGVPSALLLADNLKEGVTAVVRDASFLRAATENIPEFVASIREVQRERDQEAVREFVQIFLDLFRNRIPDYDKKSVLRVAIERPFYAAKADEVPNLWRLL